MPIAPPQPGPFSPPPSSACVWPFDNTYCRQLPGLYAPGQPAPVSAPQLLKFNEALAHELGLPCHAESAPSLALWFSGQVLPMGAEPLAQAYAGHQFGHFTPQLGDGRALLLGEVIDTHGQRRDIALKGCGRTPFSRGGDGKATLGPVLREYLIGEAMHALHIPTTRALAAVATGDTVQRTQALPGAVLTRVAASHLRIGTFEYCAAQHDARRLQHLLDYAVQRHDPELMRHAPPDRALAWLSAVVHRQAQLIAKWMHVGFIHGVMNTDNMTVSGETIDYGPCAFMEAHDPQTAFSAIDAQGRYAYGHQASIALWNLSRLAECLLPLINAQHPQQAIARVVPILETFAETFDAAWLSEARRKLGLHTADDNDLVLAHDWIQLMHQHGLDHTLAWRCLAHALEADPWSNAAHSPRSWGWPSLTSEPAALAPWFVRWRDRVAHDLPLPTAQRAQAMQRVNPVYIPRNHRVEEALSAAHQGDLGPFNTLLSVLSDPYTEHAHWAHYAEAAPMAYTADYQTFCGT